MYLGWLADMVLIYGYTEANKNSQTPVTGPSAVLQEYNSPCQYNGMGSLSQFLSIFTERFPMHIILKHF